MKTIETLEEKLRQAMLTSDVSCRKMGMTNRTVKMRQRNGGCHDMDNARARHPT